MKTQELKAIKSNLEFGDVTTIAKELGISTQTIRNAFIGKCGAETMERIMNHARIIINQRKERKNKIK